MFLFFKQKTAYEMRISYWSSDVCSSDLDAELLRLYGLELCHPDPQLRHRHPAVLRALAPFPAIAGLQTRRRLPISERKKRESDTEGVFRMILPMIRSAGAATILLCVALPAQAAAVDGRSEEHKSELQSLMRHSYAVFCL